MMLKLLIWLLPYREIGWKGIGEVFYRFTLMKTPWFNLYLHRLWAPNPHPQCHDHPWWFYTLILKGGYLETQEGVVWTWRSPGTILYRPAEFKHNVVTLKTPVWSLVLTGPREREWGFLDCN